MSHNQSRGDRSESIQYRKNGRSGSFNQKSCFGYGKGGGNSSNFSNPSNRSFKKNNSNAPGGPLSEGRPNVSSNSTEYAVVPAVQNGTHQGHPSPRTSEDSISRTNFNFKQRDTSNSNISQAVHGVPHSHASPAAPSSSSSTAVSNSQKEMMAAKQPAAPGDASGSFPLQFGSISPGIMNGVQIPARTSSAPPNLDEQKKDQARHDALRAAVTPNMSMPKHHSPNMNSKFHDQPNTSKAPPVPKPKIEVPHFGGPIPQMQSHSVPGMSLPIPMSLPMGNPSVQQSILVPNIQTHPLHPQGITHQGQSLNFSSQMGLQIPPQLGNIGTNMAPQFLPQQAGKYSGSRKAVKITHPETHEELMLDGSPGLKLHSGMPIQSQHIPSAMPAHPINYHLSSHSGTSSFFPSMTTAPPNSNQVPPSSLPPRLYNQVTVKPAGVSFEEKDTGLPTSSHYIENEEPSKLFKSRGEGSVHLAKEFGSSSSKDLQQSNPSSEITLKSLSVADFVHVKTDPSNTAFSHPAIVLNPAPISCSLEEEARHGTAVSSKPFEDKHKNPSKHQEKVDEQSISLLSLASQLSGAAVLGEKSSTVGFVLETVERPLLASEFIASRASSFTSNGAGDENIEEALKSLGDNGLENKISKPETMETKEEGEAIFSVNFETDKQNFDTSLISLSKDSIDIHRKFEDISDHEVASANDGLCGQKLTEESLGVCVVCVSGVDHEAKSSCTKNRGNNMLMNDKRGAKTPLSNPSMTKSDISCVRKTTAVESAVPDHGVSPTLLTVSSQDLMKQQGEDVENNNRDLLSSPGSVKESLLSGLDAAKGTVPPVKKKKKDLYRKAEAAGTSSDLYMAYKGPEQKKEAETTLDGTENGSAISIKQKSFNASQEIYKPSKEPSQSKEEPDNWEEAAEISTPKLEILRNESESGVEGIGSKIKIKRYSSDFLFTFAKHCTDLPHSFQITADFASSLMVSSISISRETYPSPGQNIDRPSEGCRPDHRNNGMAELDKWSKLPGPPMMGRGYMGSDFGYDDNTGFRSNHGGNHGSQRNPRAVTPALSSGSIISGSTQSLGSQGGMQRHNFDSGRWQRGVGFQKVLTPYPQTPLEVMHKAEKRYEVGVVSDEEECKQRQLKAILNKLTPQNFEKLFEKVKQVNIDNVITLSGVISQIFDKALMEPTFCEMYANFCFYLAADLPDLSVENQKITFKRLLLNKCQEEFERGEKEEEEANKAEEEDENKLTVEEREEKRLQARRLMLGNIRLIGELYKKKMLTERIMHECIKKLLGQNQIPDEENVEALCKLMSTIGGMIDHSLAKDHIDYYFDIMALMSNNVKLSSRVRFMLKDTIDLRKNKWQQRRKVEGPKKIEDVHRDAAQERHVQANRLGRASSFSNSVRRGPPMEFSLRVPSLLSSPSSQMGSFRAVSQPRSAGSQDVQLEPHENKNMSVPTPHRARGENSITLGPQGGLAQGMALRSSSKPEQTAYGQGEDPISRYGSVRSSAQYISVKSHSQEREISNENISLDKSRPTSSCRGTSGITQNTPEEHLRDKSMTIIKEFYSAKDEKEVILCIKDLNFPSFYPSMIAVWVTDSFERKENERALLTKLLINLAKSRDTMITDDQLVKGFESVLTTLEDAVNDAPKAAEFLGHILAKITVENIISLSEIGRLIFEGGEEQGRLVEIGLAAEVLGSILEMIRSENGDSGLNKTLSSSNLQLKNFRPPGSNKSWKIDKFI